MAELTRRTAGPATVRTLADAERAHIAATLRETNWVVGGRAGAAAKLGVPRTTLLSRMRRLGMRLANPGKKSDPPFEELADRYPVPWNGLQGQLRGSDGGEDAGLARAASF
jgi:Bacterial regulatory protein, Fis family